MTIAKAKILEIAAKGLIINYYIYSDTDINGPIIVVVLTCIYECSHVYPLGSVPIKHFITLMFRTNVFSFEHLIL